jgi:hypothetical protein
MREVDLKNDYICSWSVSNSSESRKPHQRAQQSQAQHVIITDEDLPHSGMVSEAHMLMIQSIGRVSEPFVQLVFLLSPTGFGGLVG